VLGSVPACYAVCRVNLVGVWIYWDAIWRTNFGR
jgi:hypothetical protein